MEALLGDHIRDHENKQVTVSSLQGKHVLLYFSAHWCSPCRQFTPQLADYYNKVLKAKNAEIIFVSADKTKHDFEEYFKTMPFLCLDFEFASMQETKTKMKQEFGIPGIPCLVLLNEHGKLVTKFARDYVHSDPTGEQFPNWQ